MKSKVSFFIIVFVCCLVVGCGKVKQSRIESFVNAERANLPKMLFVGLEAIDVQAAESELIYVCRPKGVPEDRVAQMKGDVEDGVKAYVRRKSDQLKSLIDYEIKLTIAVNDGGGKELYRVSVNPWEL